MWNKNENIKNKWIIKVILTLCIIVLNYSIVFGADGSRNSISGTYNDAVYLNGQLFTETYYSPDYWSGNCKNTEALNGRIIQRYGGVVHNVPDTNWGFQNIHSGTNDYIFQTNIFQGRTVSIYISSADISNYVGSFKIIDNAGNKYTLSEAVTNDLIDPLVIIGSESRDTSSYWQNTVNLYSGGNTATSYYFPGVVILFKPNIELTGVEFYSYQNVSLSNIGLKVWSFNPSDVQLSLTDPSKTLTTTITALGSVTAESGAYNPNPITITANVNNPTPSTLSNVDVELKLPAGLTLLSGQNSKQTIDTIANGASKQISWQVKCEPQKDADATLSYQVVVTPEASSGINGCTVTKQITVPKAIDYEAYELPSSLGNSSQATYGADSVNVANGNFYYTNDSASVSTEDNFGFSASYNSRSTYSGLLGSGWTYNYDYVLTSSTYTQAAIQYPDGKSINFSSMDGTTFYGDGTTEVLVKNADGTYKLTYADGKTVNFDTNKKLTSIVDSSGNRVLFTYGTNLITVTDEKTARTIKIILNASGKISSVTDPMNQTMDYTYDTNGRLWKVADLNGNETVYAYDTNGCLSTTTDASGNQVGYQYDDKGRVTQQTDGEGKTTTYTYNTTAAEPNTTVTDPLGNVTTYYYDANMNTTKTVYSDGSTESYGYDQYGNRNSITDTDGNKTSCTYDAKGNVLSETDTKDNTATYTYNAQSEPLISSDAEGNIKKNIYDDDGNLITTSTKPVGAADFTVLVEYIYYPETIVNGKKENTAKGLVHYMIRHVDNDSSHDQTTEYYYDTNAYVDKEIDAQGKIWDYTYDDNGRKLDETDPLGNKTSYTYQPDGKLASQTSPGFDNMTTADDITTTNTYYANGNLQFVTYQNGTKIEYKYDKNNRIVEQYDQLNHKTSTMYDANGNQDYVIDANGKTTDYETSILTNTSTVMDPTGRKETTQYDSNGNVDFTLDWLGQKTDYIYDSLNRLTGVTDPLGNTTSYTYTALGYQDKVTDAKGNVTDYDYDINGNLIKVTYSNGKSISYTYDLVGNQISYTNEEGKIWSYTYDKNNRLISIKDPYSVVTESYTYYDNGLTATKSDAMGRIMTYTYYANGLLKSEKDSLGNGLAYEYDTNGNKTDVFDSENNKTKYEYNACNWLTKVYTPNDTDNANITYDYDNLGNKITVTDANGKVWTYHYDDAGRQDQVTDPLNNSNLITYAPSTAMKNYIINTDASGKATTIYYNALNQVTSVTGSSGMASFGYDANGNLDTVTDGNGNETTHTYNSMDKLESTTDALGNTWQYSYNGDGTLLKKTSPDGKDTTYQYDDAGRLVTVSYADGSQVSYEYYIDGSRKKMTETNGTTEYSYNGINGLVETVTRTPNGGTAQTITYHYNSRNLLDFITYPDGKTAVYTYDSRGLLASAQFTEDAKALTITTDANGKVDSEALPNDITVDYTYDDAGRLTGITHGTVVKSLYTLAANGNRETMETNEGTTTYQYDDQNQLIKVDYPNGQSVQYTCDNAGNRTSTVGDGIDLANLPSGTIEYTYDDADRLIAYSGPAFADAIYTDSAISSTYTGSAISTNYTGSAITINYDYDGDGNLCEKTTKDENGNTIAHSLFFYDYSAGLPRILVEYDVLNNRTIDYTYAGRLYGKYQDSQMYYYHQDGLGSILAITDASGNVKNTYTYDAFGDIRSKTETISNSILFTGEMVDESGLVYLRARLYDPTIGRFLTRDTYEGNTDDPQSLNLYTYCQNNPTMYVDPSGHFIDTVLDVVFIAADLRSILADPTKVSNWVALAADAVCAAVPGATGGGTVVRLAAKADDVYKAAKAATKALSVSKKIKTFGSGKVVLPYKYLQTIMKGTGLEVHHLVEKRFASKLGLKENEMVSIAIDPKLHDKITAAMRKKIGYNFIDRFKDAPTTSEATAQQVWNATKEVYTQFGMTKYLEVMKKQIQTAAKNNPKKKINIKF